MNATFPARVLLPICLALATAGTVQAQSAAPVDAQPAASAFDRFRALVGEWVDVDGDAGAKGQVVASYRLTGAGSAVVETMFPGSKHEMTTIYHRDGGDIVLTHYCAVGNQPRMRAKTVEGNAVAFAFDGGANIDPAKDMHMHDARMEFLGADEIRAQWQSWDKGAPAQHAPKIRLVRRKG